MSLALGYIAGLIPPWFKWAALALLFAFTFAAGARFGGGHVQQKWDHEKAERTAQALQATQEARRIEQARQRVQQGIEDAKDAELRRTGARLADALEQLRNRPERLPEPARAACSGATGAELSGPDAAFLERYAAEARRVQLELGACQQRGHAAMTP